MSGGSYNYICDKLSMECAGSMYDAEMNDLIEDLCKVLHDLEWWQSCDSSEEVYRETVAKFKEKWFQGPRKGEWTPANNPPKKSGRYLAYIVNEYDEKFEYQMTADYIAIPRPIEGLSPWNLDDECASDNVIAWMPLPEPYKEGDKAE